MQLLSWKKPLFGIFVTSICLVYFLFSSKEILKFQHFFSTQESVKFTENIDVVTYLNGKRETHNPDGRAYAPVVWDFYQVTYDDLSICKE